MSIFQRTPFAITYIRRFHHSTYHCNQFDSRSSWNQTKYDYVTAIVFTAIPILFLKKYK